MNVLLALLLLMQGAAASWLDAPPVAWNVTGSPPPAAPAGHNTDPRCATNERPPDDPAEVQLADLGWKLESYWPSLSNGQLTLVTALSDYDGMCRPWAFNVFAFAADGQYAGRLSPVDMFSRTDGVLVDGPRLLPDGSIEAEFIRYASSDPLCCPSAGRTRVLYAVESTAAGPLVVPVQIGAALLPSPAQVP